jgi:hypothetical protein
MIICTLKQSDCENEARHLMHEMQPPQYSGSESGEMYESKNEKMKGWMNGWKISPRMLIWTQKNSLRFYR